MNETVELLMNTSPKNVNSIGNNNMDENTNFSDVDSTVAVADGTTTTTTKSLYPPDALSKYSDNTDDTSTIATIASTVQSSVSAVFERIKNSQSVVSTDTTPTSSKKSTTDTRKSFTNYGLSGLLQHNRENSKQPQMEEKKVDGSSNTTVGIQQNIADSVDDTPTVNTDETTVTDITVNDTYVNQTTGKAIANKGTGTSKRADITATTTTANVEPLHTTMNNASSATTGNKQTQRRDLRQFMTIHKEMQHPNLLPRPAEPTTDTKQISKNIIKHQPLVPKKENQESAQPKRRGRPPTQKRKDTNINIDKVDVKRQKSDKQVVATTSGTGTGNENNSDEVDRPKVPLYAYELFSREYRRAYAAANRNNKGNDMDDENEEVDAVILQQWNTMSDKDKRPYVLRATQDRELFHQQTQVWNQKTKNGTTTTEAGAGATTTTTTNATLNHPNDVPRSNNTTNNVRTMMASADPIDRKNSFDHLKKNDINTKNSHSPRPRGRPKVGHVWDQELGRWKLPGINDSTNLDEYKDTGSIDHPTLGLKWDDRTDLSFKTVETNELSVNMNNDGPIEKWIDNSINNTDDDHWYTKLQSTPMSDGDNQGTNTKNMPVTTHTTAPVANNAVAGIEPKQRKKQILSPKRPPKINQDGSYRKPGGPQPVGYIWNAEFGYWESAIESDSNMQRILDFDHDDDAVDKRADIIVKRRRQSMGSGMTGTTTRHRKYEYTKDGCIIPRQTLERSLDGKYVRPLGRPIVGYEWDAIRGLWTPTSTTAQSAQRHSISTIEQRPIQKKMTISTAGNKNRLYTSDGCILPMKTPTKSSDGKYVRPFGRSIVGYTWDYHRGVWAPNGGPIPTKNSMPQPPSHFVGPIRLADKLVLPLSKTTRKDECKYIACTRCESCTIKQNCGQCLHCMIKEHHSDKAGTQSPFLSCCHRICQEAILNPNYTDAPNNMARNEENIKAEEMDENDDNDSVSNNNDDDDIEEEEDDDDDVDHSHDDNDVDDNTDDGDDGHNENVQTNDDEDDDNGSMMESLSDENNNDEHMENHDNVMNDVQG
jgi:hypothetical protein